MKILEIIALAGGGRGVARDKGKVWLVEGAVPGDRVAVEVVRERNRLGEARALEVLEPSLLRRDPPCRFQPFCGGCPWMVLPEGRQRFWKHRLVSDALNRIGKIEEPPLAKVVPSPRSLGYRGKVELSLGEAAGGEVILGFRSRYRPDEVIDIDECLLAPDPVNRVLGEIRERLGAAREVRGPGRNPVRGRPDPDGKRLVLRYSFLDRNVLIGFRAQGREWSGPRGGAFDEDGIVTGVVSMTGIPGRRGGVRVRKLWGRGHLREKVGKTVFMLPAAAFFQVNPGAASLLVQEVLEGAGPPSSSREEVLDLYGGVGLYGWALALAGRSVTICEADEEAVRSGERSADFLSTKRSVPTFVRADVGRFLDGRFGKRPVKLVVANPPRAGLAKGVPEKILHEKPETIILVSCDPGTLARDLRRFVSGGYRLERVVPVDLFPQTPHVETVTLLRWSGRSSTQ